jgi:hypothetical protein
LEEICAQRATFKGGCQEYMLFRSQIVPEQIILRTHAYSLLYLCYIVLDIKAIQEHFSVRGRN